MMTGAGELLVNGQTATRARDDAGRDRALADHQRHRRSLPAPRARRSPLHGRRHRWRLLAQPLPGLTEWLLAPAQRVEIVVTIAAQQSSARYALRDLGYAGGMSGGAGGELMTIETGRRPRRHRLNCRQRCDRLPISAPRAPGSGSCFPAAGMGMMGSFLINGRTFDMNRVDLETVVGRVELWDLVNTTFMDHPIHIHGTQFQVVARTVRRTCRSGCLSGVARHRECAGGRDGHHQDAADDAGQADVPLPHPAARGCGDDGRAGRTPGVRSLWTIGRSCGIHATRTAPRSEYLGGSCGRKPANISPAGRGPATENSGQTYREILATSK